jgi:hypothetical protein
MTSHIKKEPAKFVGPKQGPDLTRDEPLMGGARALLGGALSSAGSAGVAGAALGLVGAVGHNLLLPEDKPADPVQMMMRIGLPLAAHGAVSHLGTVGIRSLSNKFRGE